MFVRTKIIWFCTSTNTAYKKIIQYYIHIINVNNKSSRHKHTNTQLKPYTTQSKHKTHEK